MATALISLMNSSYNILPSLQIKPLLVLILKNIDVELPCSLPLIMWASGAFDTSQQLSLEVEYRAIVFPGPVVAIQ